MRRVVHKIANCLPHTRIYRIQEYYCATLTIDHRVAAILIRNGHLFNVQSILKTATKFVFSVLEVVRMGYELIAFIMW